MTKHLKDDFVPGRVIFSERYEPTFSSKSENRNRKQHDSRFHSHTATVFGLGLGIFGLGQVEW